MIHLYHECIHNLAVDYGSFEKHHIRLEISGVVNTILFRIGMNNALLLAEGRCCHIGNVYYILGVGPALVACGVFIFADTEKSRLEYDI